MRDILAITKALADEKRLRMLLALRGRELCLCQLVALVELAPSTTSKHMSILRQAGLVEGRKSGRWVYYRLADQTGSAVVRNVLAWVQGSLADDPTIQGDAARLRHILASIPTETCAGSSGTEGSCACADATVREAADRVAPGVSRV